MPKQLATPCFYKKAIYLFLYDIFCFGGKDIMGGGYDDKRWGAPTSGPRAPELLLDYSNFEFTTQN